MSLDGDNSYVDKSEENLEDLEIIQSTVFASILKNAVQELTILNEICKVPQAKVNLEYVSLDDKYNVVDFEKTNDVDVSALEERKFQTDRTFVEKVLKSTIQDLIDHQSFDNLRKILKDYLKSKRDEKELLEDRSNIEMKMEKLRSLQQNDRTTFCRTIKDLGDNVGNLKDQLDDARVDFEYKTSYLIRWEESRNEQHDKILNDKERGQSKVISKCDIRTIREDRLHEEIVSYLTETYHDHEEAIEMWMEKYDSELEKRENDLNKLRMQLDNQIEAHQRLQAEYESREKQMEKYLVIKEQRRKEAKELEDRIEAAIKIQAWWRGTMVRKGLGPYRKKKAKGKKDSGNQGKKKK